MEWEKLTCYKGSYLRERGISDWIVSTWGVLQDDVGNACFLHYDLDGICGWEIKNRGANGETITKFSPNGRRGLGLLQIDRALERHLVICESTIDAMSYAMLFRQSGAVYVSLAGPLDPNRKELLLEACKCYKPSKLIIATDADIKGERIATEIQHFLQGLMKISIHMPTQGKDWNEQLNLKLNEQITTRQFNQSTDV